MRKGLFIAILTIAFSSFLIADDIKPTSANLSMDMIDAAIEVYNAEIQLQEDNCTGRILVHLYSERGNLHFAKKNYQAALSDYQKAIEFIQKNQLNDASNLLQGMCGSLFCYEFLNEEQSSKNQFDELVYHVALHGDKIDNIDWFRNSTVYPVYKENRKLNPPRIQKIDLPPLTAEESCQLQCDGYAVAAAYACQRVPDVRIQCLCYGCIFGLERLCSRCCLGDGFWKNCVQGLRRLFHDPEHPQKPAQHPFE